MTRSLGEIFIAAKGSAGELVGRTVETMDLQAARARAAELASRVLARLESPILAARELSGLRFQVGVSESDPDFLVFVGVDSETDALPVGRSRMYWAPEALAAKADEIAQAEAWALKVADAALRSIIQRFGGTA